METKPKLIGVFETLYKNRQGEPANRGQIETLDRSIDGIAKHISLISDEKYSHLRRNMADFKARHIFKDRIDHRDGRSTGDSISENTGQGILIHFYEELSAAILNIVEGSA